MSATPDQIAALADMIRREDFAGFESALVDIGAVEIEDTLSIMCAVIEQLGGEVAVTSGADWSAPQS